MNLTLSHKMQGLGTRKPVTGEHVILSSYTCHMPRLLVLFVKGTASGIFLDRSLGRDESIEICWSHFIELISIPSILEVTDVTCPHK